ncbi:YafY family protein [Leptolyngbya sp. FACHB-261]|uniref:helix-turn-helix transcriptional regulator n=1 Tax=Leptolyngbya sp. FACHB-261 TaxID=2692806 RepID=UPI001682043F|nr:WYL domain-containing protein [Leptolyngbya sp. FACHB-261]MBD2102395.1 WYL domain-containing protein [Leptolyngbya sp. FACHB-261]
MGRRGQSITLSVSERDKAQLEALAQELGMMWGDRPNITKLVEAIARRQLLVGKNNDWSEARIQMLNRVRQFLIDAGQVEDAEALASLLLERGELSAPLRKEIEHFLETPPFPWRTELDSYIRRQQPFRLAYQDAAERAWSFTIRFARIAARERRQYLECWVEEVEGGEDIPELVHNRSLRIDRIPEAAVVPIRGEWLPDLAQVKVEMHLFAGLAFAYRAKPQDEVSEWIPDRPDVRRVMRPITQTFWFVREVLPYGGDCEVISPASVRDKVKAEMQRMCSRYGLTVSESGEPDGN